MSAQRAEAPRRASTGQAQRGAALLTALLIVVLVTTLASAMLWRQARSIQIESAERGRSQSEWVLQGALDWARLILREDARANQNDKVDHLGEVWAVPLAEASLSSFLSTDENHSADGAPDAYLSGHIEDAQARYNLNNLIQTDPTAKAKQLAIAQRLFSNANLSSSVAEQIQNQLIQASTTGSTSTAALAPARVEQLAWLGLTTEQIERLRPLVVFLPGQTSAKVNINTAPREVIAALADGMSLATADQIIRARATKPFRKASDLSGYLPQNLSLDDVAQYSSDYFYVTGQLRLEDRLVTMRSLINRSGLEITVKDREYLQQSTALPTSSSSSR